MDGYKNREKENFLLLKSHPNLFLIPGSRPGAPSGTSGFPHSSGGKESAFNAGDPGLIPESGRSPAEGNGKPLQYSCLENPMDRGALWATAYGVSRAGHDLATKRLLLHILGEVTGGKPDSRGQSQVMENVTCHGTENIKPKQTIEKDSNLTSEVIREEEVGSHKVKLGMLLKR